MASTTSPALTAVTVLGKRSRTNARPLVLHFSGSEADTDAESLDLYLPSASDAPEAGPSTLTRTPLSENTKTPVPGKKKKYACSHDGCSKAYAKPARLAEHERTHTGERPYVCSTCNKSYTRETHLQAHARTHLPDSERAFACEEPGCEKRFWTAQHLARHRDGHAGEKPFKCTEPTCDQAFTKQNQLRTHIASAHAPAGTKPYICAHAGCPKSFSTAQKLRAHAKTHDARRYTCSHARCLAAPAPAYFATWTALQHHLRTAHPPTCPHAGCGGKTFTQQKGLRAHLRLHDEDRLLHSDVEDDAPRKRRRGGGFACAVEGCFKDFRTQRALDTHHGVTHLGRRDFVCVEPGCGHAFGYKHLLQRHTAKMHGGATAEAVPGPSGSSASSEEESSTETEPDIAFSIDDITGVSYSAQRTLRCPFPHLDLNSADLRQEGGCRHAFTRAYDLRRHLKAAHGVEKAKAEVDAWVTRMKGVRHETL